MKPAQEEAKRILAALTRSCQEDRGFDLGVRRRKTLAPPVVDCFFCAHRSPAAATAAAAEASSEWGRKWEERWGHLREWQSQVQLIGPVSCRVAVAAAVPVASTVAAEIHKMVK